MLVLLPPVKTNESNFWRLTSLSQRAVGETALPCWYSAVGSNENEPHEYKWQPLTLTLLGNMFWLISWVVAPLVVTEVRELWWPLQEVFWTFLTFQLPRHCDHHSNGLPAVLWRNKTDLDQVSDIFFFVKFTTAFGQFIGVMYLNQVSVFCPRHLYPTVMKCCAKKKSIKKHVWHLVGC